MMRECLQLNVDHSTLETPKRSLDTIMITSNTITVVRALSKTT